MWYPIEKKWCTVFLFVVTTCVVRDNCCACTRYHSLAIIFTVPSPPQLNKCWSVHANPVTPYRLNCDPQHRKHATNTTQKASERTKHRWATVSLGAQPMLNRALLGGTRNTYHATRQVVVHEQLLWVQVGQV